MVTGLVPKVAAVDPLGFPPDGLRLFHHLNPGVLAFLGSFLQSVGLAGLHLMFSVHC